MGDGAWLKRAGPRGVSLRPHLTLTLSSTSLSCSCHKEKRTTEQHTRTVVMFCSRTKGQADLSETAQMSLRCVKHLGHRNNTSPDTVEHAQIRVYTFAFLKGMFAGCRVLFSYSYLFEGFSKLKMFPRGFAFMFFS